MASFPVAYQGPVQTVRKAVVVAAALTLCAAGVTLSARAHAAQGRAGADPVAVIRTAVVRPVVQLPEQVAGVIAADHRQASDSGETIAAAPAEPATRPDFYLPVAAVGPATKAEQALLQGLNLERTRQGLAALAYDEGLNHIARTRARQLLDQGYFGHIDPAGYAMYTELLALDGRSYAWAGENLAMNTFPAAESPSHAVAALMASSAHRQNILATDFTRVGVGEVTTPDGRHIYAMIFLG